MIIDTLGSVPRVTGTFERLAVCKLPAQLVLALESGEELVGVDLIIVIVIEVTFDSNVLLIDNDFFGFLLCRVNFLIYNPFNCVRVASLNLSGSLVTEKVASHIAHLTGNRLLGIRLWLLFHVVVQLRFDVTRSKQILFHRIHASTEIIVGSSHTFGFFFLELLFHVFIINKVLKLKKRKFSEIMA